MTQQSDSPQDPQAQDLPPAGPPRNSLWAMAGLFSSCAICCPVLTVLGPLLALRALVQINAEPRRYAGRGIAKAAIFIGLVATVLQLGVAVWWNRNVRQPMLHGPSPEIRAGQRKDWNAVRAGFIGDGASASDPELEAFFNELSHRCGALIEVSQRSSAKAELTPDALALRLPYTMRFEAGTFDADAELSRQGRLLPDLKWRWMRIHDPVAGDLVYPASARPPAITPASQPASQPAMGGPSP